MRLARDIVRAVMGLAVFAAVHGFVPVPLESQETPETLVEHFVEGVRDRDRMTLQGLIHPVVEAALSEARIERAKEGWFKRPVPAGYKLKWMKPDEVARYDSECRHLQNGRKAKTPTARRPSGS